MSTQEQAEIVADEATGNGSVGAASGHEGEIAVTNPATGETIAWVKDSTAEEVAEAVARGRAVQPAWEALGFRGRAKILKRVQRWVVENADLIVETIVKENGKTWEDAQLADVLYAGASFQFWSSKTAEKYLADEPIHASNRMLAGKKLYTRFAPLGVIGVIGPWNYPFVNGFGDCVPALAAGNSVVLKPSEETPLTSLLFEKVLRECGMPKGVLQVVNGKGATAGKALVDNVDMIMFTGSTATGKQVAKQAAERLIPCCLELGGKDPFIVCDDADIDRAANQAVFYSMFNGGQTCISVERCYVMESVYDEFVTKVVEKAKELRVGVPTEPGIVDMGALTSEAQRNVVISHVEDAKAKGATVLVGGNPNTVAHLGDGHFYPPTVLTDVDHTMLCMTEETFGPTLPIMKVKNVEEAIKYANDSQYGLMASVYTKDIAKGEAIARRLNVGSVNVNDSLVAYLAIEMPMGGLKESGLGVRHGAYGIRKYCRQQSVLVSRFHLQKEPQTFPHTGLSFKAFRAFMWVTLGLRKPQ